jgi:hypothetical protein
MSLIPGIAGQKTELFDGAKIDAISEYTAGNGVQLQGRSNGVAIEAGKVGEEKSAVKTTPVTMNTSIKYLDCTLSLEAGVWMVHMHVFGAKGNATVIEGGISTSSSALDTSANPYNCDRGPHRGYNSAASAVETANYVLIASRYFRVTSTTPVYAVASQNGTTGNALTYMLAIRIA